MSAPRGRLTGFSYPEWAVTAATRSGTIGAAQNPPQRGVATIDRVCLHKTNWFRGEHKPGRRTDSFMTRAEVLYLNSTGSRHAKYNKKQKPGAAVWFLT